MFVVLCGHIKIPLSNHFHINPCLSNVNVELVVRYLYAFSNECSHQTLVLMCVKQSMFSYPFSSRDCSVKQLDFVQFEVTCKNIAILAGSSSLASMLCRVVLNKIVTRHPSASEYPFSTT